MSEVSKRVDDIYVYKPFVDGLRAISILAVVAYHAGLPGIPGGFVGVDVFFVISGYLIINQIIADLRDGRFSFADFWMRRVLRILPPYLLVVGATLAIAPFVLLAPIEYRELGREAVQSATMTVNYHFFNSQGYFDAAAYTKPLLHLWSLAVEEQFYVVAPPLLFGLWYVGRRLGRQAAFWPLALLVLGAVSFYFCIVHGWRPIDPTFYLAPYRAWEFVLGGMVPFLAPLLRRAPRPVIDLVGLAGGGLVVAAVVLLNERMAYPSYHALAPVGGASLIILAGLARPRTPVARLLAAPPLVWIGLVSYAWYLWHWPLISYVRIAHLGDPVPAWIFGAALLSLGLAAATRYWLELPIKRWRKTRVRTAMRWPVFAAGVAGMLVAGCIGAFYGRLLPEMIAKGNERMWPAIAVVGENDPCALVEETAFNPDCPAPTTDQPVGLLIGNSHARMIYTTMLEVAHEAGTTLVSLIAGGCLPYYPTGSLKLGHGRPAQLPARCIAHITEGIATLKRDLHKPPTYAILSARWNQGRDTHRRIAPLVERDLKALHVKMPPPKGFRPIQAIGLAGTIAQLNEMGVERILVVGPVPELDYDAPQCVARAKYYGFDMAKCAMPRASIDRRRRSTIKTLRYIADSFPNVRFVDPIDIFCNDKSCYPYTDDGVLYIDDDHLSALGAKLLYERLRADFTWAMTGTEPQPSPVADNGHTD